MTNKDAISNIAMIRAAYIEPVTKLQRKIIDDTFDMAIEVLSQQPCDDAISRQAAIDAMATWDWQELYLPIHFKQLLEELPSVSTEKTGRCKDCKWWKDSDGLYRRGGHAESLCPINRREVFEGNGYCYMFEPKTQEVEE